jgi:hypothetical protein
MRPMALPSPVRVTSRRARPRTRRGPGVDLLPGALFHGNALPGEDALVHQDPVGLQEAAVGGHPVPGLEAHHVPGDDLPGGEPLELPVPQNPGHGLRQGLEAP